FKIGFADGIFAFWPSLSYSQRSKCADLLNSYLPSNSSSDSFLEGIPNPTDIRIAMQRITACSKPWLQPYL
ncbi:MAG: hypothetical protein Q4F76_12490, partial [Lachnospiraceae bacterium]|nr:hypothetical protein [Lachnospiraceae bacterium]